MKLQAMNRRDWLIILCLFVLAFLLRSATFGQATDVDTATWIRDAQEMLRGGVLYRDIDTTKPPLLCFIISASLWASGGSILFLRFVVAMLTASIAPALYLMGRRLFGSAAGVAAGLLFALDLLSIWYGKFSHVSTLLPVFETWTICLLVLFWKRRAAWMILPGIAAGLAFAMKQPGIIMIPVGILCLILGANLRQLPGVEREGVLKDILVRSACYCAGFALILLPFAFYFMAKHAGKHAIEAVFLIHRTLLARTHEFSKLPGFLAKFNRVLTIAGSNSLLWAAAAFFPVAFFWKPKREKLIPALWLVAVASFYLFVYYSSSDHYLLEWIPPVALLAGVSAQFLWTAFKNAGPLSSGQRALILFAAWLVMGLALAMLKMGRLYYAASAGALFFALLFGACYLQCERPALKSWARVLLIPTVILALLPYYIQRYESQEVQLKISDALLLAQHVRELPHEADEKILLMAPGLNHLLPDVEMLPVILSGVPKISPMGLTSQTALRSYNARVVEETLAHYSDLKIRYLVIYTNYWHLIETEPHNAALLDFIKKRFLTKQRFSLSDCYYGNVLIMESRQTAAGLP